MAKFYERKDYVQYKAGEWGVTEEEARRRIELEEEKLKQEFFEFGLKLGLSEEAIKETWEDAKRSEERFFDYKRHDEDQDENTKEATKTFGPKSIK